MLMTDPARLTSRQRAYLRGLAHQLKPVLHLGKEGVTPSTVEAAEEVLNTRELFKMRILENAPEGTRAVAEALVEKLDGAQVVQVMGRTAVVYRPDRDQPVIELPA